jgi:DNA-binding response OmpR family regulator
LHPFFPMIAAASGSLRAPDVGSIRGVTDASPGQDRAPLRVLVYSSNAGTRERVRLALGRRPHPDLPPLEFVEVATPPAVIARFDAGGLDLAILDGEASPAGGLGVAKQVKDEIDAPPPILVLIGRADDAWLAKWSRAEAAVAHPIDPIELTSTVVALLRGSVQSAATER